MGFDTLNHDLSIAKLHIYGFSEVSPLLIKSYYLTNPWQITKVNTSFSTLTEILQGLPQGSVLGSYFSICMLLIFFILLC